MSGEREPDARADANAKIAERIRDIIYFRATNSEESVRRALADQFGFSPAEVEAAMAESSRLIREAGAPDIATEAGLLLTRNEELYLKAIKKGDGERAAQLQRDRLAILTRLTPGAETEHGGNEEAEQLAEQIDTARTYLEGIEGVRKGLPIEDLAREVLTRFIEIEKDKLKSAA